MNRIQKHIRSDYFSWIKYLNLELGYKSNQTYNNEIYSPSEDLHSDASLKGQVEQSNGELSSLNSTDAGDPLYSESNIKIIQT